MKVFAGMKTTGDVVRIKKLIAKTPELREELMELRAGGYYTKSGKKREGAYMMPSTSELRRFYDERVRLGIEEPNPFADTLLRKMLTKSNSGVAVVSLLTKPFPCPGRCTYCPNDVRMPKSYLADEPAAARALANEFDSYQQTTNRIRALANNGHPVDKLEVIVIGGTWSFYEPTYQEEFLIGLYRACNDWQSGADSRCETYDDRRAYLTELQRRNETGRARVVGLSIETRPDYVTDFEIARLRMFGVTKVELGVQHLDDAVLSRVKRDMTIARVKEATEKLREAGFKIVYHIMPNLPGSTPERDITMFHELFSGKDFQPDMLKIYPCVVLAGTELYEEWRRGEFRAYTDDELKMVLVGGKKFVPPYVRIQRVVRDIPAQHIIAGSKLSNMREVIAEDMRREHWYCQCVRCREIREGEVRAEEFKLVERRYETTHGKEYFLSFERDDEMGGRLASFARLRVPDDLSSAPTSALVGAALIRELHTYGRAARVGAEGTQGQHVGFGRRLVARAEEIARASGAHKLAIIAGVGVREYYRRLGYELVETYMIKSLSDGAISKSGTNTVFSSSSSRDKMA